MLFRSFLFLISNLYSSQDNFEKSNFYLNLSIYLNPKFKFNLSLVAENFYADGEYNKVKKNSNKINVSYSGSVPNLFAEGKGVVAEGYLKDRNYFNATKILAKHDENYMPPEIKEALGEE